MGKRQSLCRQNDQSDIVKVFSSFEPSIKAFDNIFENFFLMNTVLLKFLIVAHKPGAKWVEIFGCKTDCTWSVGYSFVVHVQKDACFGLSLKLCTIFKICSQFSEKAIFEKLVKFLSAQKFQLFSYVYHAVHMHAMNWFKIWLKRIFPEKIKCVFFLFVCFFLFVVFFFFALKTNHYQTSSLKRR